MSFTARFEQPAAGNRRVSARRRLRLGSTSPRSGQDVLIHNISATGMLVQTAADLDVLEELEVELPEIGRTKAQVVWRSDDYFGCQFASPIPRAGISAALLRSPVVEPGQEEGPLDESAKTSTIETRSTELSFGTKLRILLTASMALWALIGAAAALTFW